jgi:hypothetical protein
MADADEGRVLRLYAEKRHQLVLALGIERGGCFIEHDNVRSVEKDASEGQCLLLTTRQGLIPLRSPQSLHRLVVLAGPPRSRARHSLKLEYAPHHVLHSLPRCVRRRLVVAAMGVDLDAWVLVRKRLSRLCIDNRAERLLS